MNLRTARETVGSLPASIEVNDQDLMLEALRKAQAYVNAMHHNSIVPFNLKPDLDTVNSINYALHKAEGVK